MGAVEDGVVGSHLLPAGVAGFADKTRFDGIGDPSDAVVALSLGQLESNLVGVIIEDVGNGTFSCEQPVIAGTGQIFPGEVTDVNFDGGARYHYGALRRRKMTRETKLWPARWL